MNYIDVTELVPDEPEARRKWLRENFKRISVPPRIVSNGVADGETLSRFVDLPKLFDLLKRKRLVLPRLRELIEADPFECHARKGFEHLNRDELVLKANQLEDYAPSSVYRLVSIPPPSHLFPSWFQRRFDSDIKQMAVDDLRNAVWILERERLKHALVCSCWHKGTIESDAMWKVYASQLGVSIRSSAARMRSSIKMILPKIYSAQAEIHLAAVWYEDTDKCGDIEPWLVKRKAFMHEKEVRLYCDVPYVFGSKFDLEIDISTFIEEIVITPFAQAWQVDAIKGAIEALLKEVGAGQIIVRQSDHMRVPEIVWPDRKEASDDPQMIVRPILGETVENSS